MGIKKTAETWIRVEVFCDGLGDDGVCLASAGDELERISDVAPTGKGAQKAIINAAVRARWRFDPKLQRWLCPECVRVRDASAQPEQVSVTDGLGYYGANATNFLADVTYPRKREPRPGDLGV